jgi:hypothetical protein
MPYDVSFSRSEGLLRMAVSGTRIPGQVVQDGLALWVKLAEEFAKDDTCSILAVFDIKGPKNYSEAYRIFEDPGRFNFRRDTAMAAVYLNREHFEAEKFGETVARNRFWNLRVFGDEAEARAWILGQRKD